MSETVFYHHSTTSSTQREWRAAYPSQMLPTRREEQRHTSTSVWLVSTTSKSPWKTPCSAEFVRLTRRCVHRNSLLCPWKSKYSIVSQFCENGSHSPMRRSRRWVVDSNPYAEIQKAPPLTAHHTEASWQMSIVVCKCHLPTVQNLNEQKGSLDHHDEEEYSVVLTLGKRYANKFLALHQSSSCRWASSEVKNFLS